EPLIEAAQGGRISEERIDQSVARILRSKFELGLFENPYVDPEEASTTVGTAEDVKLAERTQREAQVLLQNRDALLPLAATRNKVWLFGMDPEAAANAGLHVVDDPADADFAIVRAEAPSELLHPHH